MNWSIRELKQHKKVRDTQYHLIAVKYVAFYKRNIWWWAQRGIHLPAICIVQRWFSSNGLKECIPSQQHSRIWSWLWLINIINTAIFPTMLELQSALYFINYNHNVKNPNEQCYKISRRAANQNWLICRNMLMFHRICKSNKHTISSWQQRRSGDDGMTELVKF